MVKPRQRIDAVLIDDDFLVHATWQSLAKLKGKVLKTFTTIEEFMEISKEFEPEVSIFVDSNLAGGVKGETESQKIAKLGFKNIFLATGSEPSSFGAMPWIKAIVGKEPPW
jgi:hypothetical protein